MKNYIIAIDQGTTSSRAILFDRSANIVGVVAREFPQIYPREGWVEHDPIDIWSSSYGCLMEVIAKTGVSASEIAAIGITNQRETTVVWDRATGTPVMNAIVWQCCRTAPIIDEMKPHHALIREKTGLVPDAYFSASKIKWILDNVEGVRERAEAGELMFGTVDTWLIWKLTGVHATDRTNASRTMLYNINTLGWDSDLLDLFGVPASMLPDVRTSSGYFGTAKIDGCDIPVCGVAGDQQAALFGQGCFSAGDAKNTYGTGCFLLLNTGTKRETSENGLLTTICAGLENEPVTYALEGSVFCGGSVSSSGSATKCGSSPKAATRNTTRRKFRTAAACTSFPRSPVSVHPTGICTPAAPLSASRAERSGNTSSARQRNPSPTSPPTSSTPWNATRAHRFMNSASTAAQPVTIS